MRTKNKIAIATLLLCGGLLAGVGFNNFNAEEAFATEIEENVSTFEVQSVALRIPDETYGEGLRFTIVMDKDTYQNENVANLTTGILIAPTYALDTEGLVIDSDIEEMKDITDGVSWTESDGVMKFCVHLYGIPETEYATEVSIRAYVDDGNAETDPLYTDVAESSVAEAATWAYANDTTLSAEEKETLKATYLTYDVFFHDGESIEKSTGVYGEKISAPEVEDKEGYTFDGWWNNAGTAQWDFDVTTISGTTTNLYAKWNINVYTAKVVRADGSEETVEFTIENRAEKLEEITLTANDAQYTYSWISALPNELALNNDQVFTEKRDVNDYTVTFDVDGGSTVEAQTVPYGTPASELANFVSTKVGYTFAGWTMADGSAIPAGATVTGDITVKAVWTPNANTAYTVAIYQETDGAYPSEATQTINGTGTTGASVILDETWMSGNGLSIPDGYILDDKKSVLSGEIAADGSLVLSVYIREVTYISTFEQLSAIAKTSTSADTPLTGYYMLTADIDCQAQELYIHTLTGVIDGNGYSIYNAKIKNQSYGSMISYIQVDAVVKNLGLYNVTTIRNNVSTTFGLAYGLYGTIENVSYQQNASYAMTSPIGTLYSGCVIKNFVVYAPNVGTSGFFNSGSNANIVGEENIYIFTNASNKNSTAAASGTFLTGESGTDYLTTDEYKAIDFTTIFDCSENGMWEIDETLGVPMIKRTTFEVNFDTDGGSEVESITVKYGDKISAPETIPTKDGFEFDGWDFDFDTKITADTTITAKWEALAAAYNVAIYQEVDGAYPSDATQTISGSGMPGDIVTLDEAWMTENSLVIPDGYVLDTANSVLSGEITADGNLVLSVYLKQITYISTFAELSTMATAATSDTPATGYYVLTADIDCANQELYIQSFSGVLDGNGHTIYNSKNVDKNYAGVFTYINEGAVIKNIGFYNVSTIRDNGYSYGLVYTFNGTLENVSFHQNPSYKMVATIGSANAGCTINNLVIYAPNATTSGFFNSGSSANIEGEENIYVFASISNKNSTAVATGYFATGTNGSDYLTTDEYKAIDFTTIFDCSENGVWEIDETLGIPMIKKYVPVATVEYTVNIYQDTDGTGAYPGTADQTIVKDGIVGETITLNSEWMTANEFVIPTGYIIDETKSILSGDIAADGSLVLSVYLRKVTLISSYAELKAVADASTADTPTTGYYLLTTDIDCANQELYIAVLNGVFDGGGHTISNIKLINKNYRPIFGTISAGAVVKNVGFYNVTTARDNDYSFGLVYNFSGRIENVSFHQNSSKRMRALINKVNDGASIENLVVYASNVITTGLSANWDSTAIDDCTNVYLFVQISNSNSTKAADGVFLTGETGTDYLDTDAYKAIDFTTIFDCSVNGMWEMDETLGIPLIKRA